MTKKEKAIHDINEKTLLLALKQFQKQIIRYSKIKCPKNLKPVGLAGKEGEICKINKKD